MVWVGSETPKTVEQSIKNWEAQPGVSVHLQTDTENRNQWIDLKQLEGRPWAQIADVVRLYPFNEKSGWYMDVDCQPGYEFFGNLEKTTLFRTEPNSLANGIFYFTSNSDFLSTWKSQITFGLDQENTPVSSATGPGALTRTVYLYSYNFGVSRSKKDLQLAKFQHFTNWPTHFVGSAAFIPKRWREGKVATHYSNASWDDNQTRPTVGVVNFAKACIWRLRNSPIGPVVDYLRFAVTSRMRLKQKLSWPTFLAGMSVENSVMSNASSLKDLVGLAESDSEVRQVVIDLKKAFIKCDSPEVRGKLVLAGWKKKRLPHLGEVWVRPTLRGLLDSF